jgi:hypothetical protein
LLCFQAVNVRIFRGEIRAKTFHGNIPIIPQDVKTDLEEHGSQIPENDEDKFAEIMGVSFQNVLNDV